MCGIIGYIGKNVECNLIEGLGKLEYRGYDSAGLCVLRNDDFYTEKSVGNVCKLKEKTIFSKDFGLGIAHTRWATHGKITVANSHPHFSSHGATAIVHNGIIENFENLKGNLENKGAYFYSETDSEVIAKLLGERVSLNQLKKLIHIIKGTYAIAIISKKNNCIYFAKNKSPLYVATGNDEAMIASDPSCFIGKFDEFFPVDDGEYGKLSLGKVEFLNSDGEVVLKKSKKICVDYVFNDKQNFGHFMLKEIYESKQVIKNILEKYSCDMIELLQEIKSMSFNRVYLIGCGTAYHAGLMGQRFLRDNLKKDVYCERASEFPFQNQLLDEKSLCVFISQSGETIDTITALDYAKQKGARIISITNVPYSTLASKAEMNLPIFAGQEVAVASTKAYVGQCLVLYVLSQYLSGNSYYEDLLIFEKSIDFGNDEIIKKIAKKVAEQDKIIFIGRGYDYVTCLEASLKLKEISYINSVAESSGELKHGPIALVEPGTMIITVATDKKNLAKTINNAYETKSRGANLSIFTNIDLDDKLKQNFDFVFKFKNISSKLLPMQNIISLQKLAYYVALEKGLDPDKPRNLAKSVTVE